MPKREANVCTSRPRRRSLPQSPSRPASRRPRNFGPSRNVARARRRMPSTCMPLPAACSGGEPAPHTSNRATRTHEREWARGTTKRACARARERERASKRWRRGWAGGYTSVRVFAPGACPSASLVLVKTSLSRVLRRLEPPQSNATALDATDASESAVDDADEARDEAALAMLAPLDALEYEAQSSKLLRDTEPSGAARRRDPRSALVGACVRGTPASSPGRPASARVLAMPASLSLSTELCTELDGLSLRRSWVHGQ